VNVRDLNEPSQEQGQGLPDEPDACLPQIPCHITQVVSADEDRNTHLRPIQENLKDAAVNRDGWPIDKSEH